MTPTIREAVAERQREIEDRNRPLLDQKVACFYARSGPRVGDYLHIPSPDPRIPEFTRFTHDWGDHLQTGGTEFGSYYINSSGYLSYSGGLDPGLTKNDIVQTEHIKNGNIWFFDGDISGANRGVTFSVPMRVFTPLAGANLGGIYSIQCPFTLCVLDQRGHESTCNYWYTIMKHARSETAFTTEEELRNWLRANRLDLTLPLTAPGVHSFQRLKYVVVIDKESEAA